MWPYDKHETELGLAERPECSADSPGHCQDIEITISKYSIYFKQEKEDACYPNNNSFVY